MNAAASKFTLDQRRAAHALRQVESIKNGKLAEDYKSSAERLSATIVMNSLGQACATLLAQAKGESSDKDAHKRLFDHLEDWLCGSDAPVGLNKPLMNALVQSDQATYFHAQSEALAYLVWLKKFAQAFIVKSANTKSTSH